MVVFITHYKLRIICQPIIDASKREDQYVFQMLDHSFKSFELNDLNSACFRSKDN